MNTHDPRRPSIGYVVAVRDDGVTYARLVRPDPDALGCFDARQVTGATIPALPIGDAGIAGAVPCDGAEILRELDRAFRRRELAPWIPLAGVFLVWFVIAAVLLSRGSAIVVAIAVTASVAVTWIAHRIAGYADTAASASLLVYRLDEPSAARFAALQAASQKLSAAGRMWHVASEGRLLDPRQKYGARRFLRRYRIRPGLSSPARTLVNLTVPTVYGESRKYFFFPDRVLVYDDRGVRAVTYDRLAPRTTEALVVEDEDVPTDARTVETTWLHLAPDGGPDPAVENNRRYPIVLYGALEIAGPFGAAELFHCSVPGALEDFAAAIDVLAFRDEPERSAISEDEYESESREEPTDGVDDDLFEDALRFLATGGSADVDAVGKHFGVAFGRAARILTALEREGFIGASGSNGSREVRRSAIRYVELLDRASTGAPGGARSRRTRRTAARRARNRTLEPHEVLGVTATASRSDIANAYRELAQLYHPDKVATLAPEFQDLADQRMKEINAAYRVLNGGAEPGKQAGRC
ncbi:MAG: DnaJ domain-containing protein [Blastocatellia bacterium]|nr:DnaJ domain-containing protein [Blastocatellia bacterium]